MEDPQLALHFDVAGMDRADFSDFNGCSFEESMLRIGTAFSCGHKE